MLEIIKEILFLSHNDFDVCLDWYQQHVFHAIIFKSCSI